MKTSQKSTSLIMLLLSVTLVGCTSVAISQNDQTVIDPNRSTLALFYVTKTQTSPDARKIPNCDSEYLIKVEKSVWQKPTLESTLASLFNSELMNDAGGFTSTIIKDKKISVDEVSDFSKDQPDQALQVFLNQDPSYVSKDICDESRAHEQITETVRAYSLNHSFQLSLGGQLKNWECFGNSAEMCKAPSK